MYTCVRINCVCVHARAGTGTHTETPVQYHPDHFSILSSVICEVLFWENLAVIIYNMFIYLTPIFRESYTVPVWETDLLSTRHFVCVVLFNLAVRQSSRVIQLSSVSLPPSIGLCHCALIIRLSLAKFHSCLYAFPQLVMFYSLYKIPLCGV